MSYTKTQWVNNSEPYINATNLNHIEDGIEANDIKSTNNENAISQTNNKIGDLTNLTTTNKSNIVSALNEIKSNIGDLPNLTTTTKSNVVSSINEVVDNISNLTPALLYDNGGTNTRYSSYTLGDSISNYKFIEVIGRFYTGATLSFKTPTNYANFTVSGVDFNAGSESSGNIYYHLTKFSMSGTSITHVKTGYGRDNSFGVENNNAFIIDYIYGYK